MSGHGSALDGSEEVYQGNQENISGRLRVLRKNSVENQENSTRPANRTVLGAIGNNPLRQPVQRGTKQVRLTAFTAWEGLKPKCYLVPCARCTTPSVTSAAALLFQWTLFENEPDL